LKKKEKELKMSRMTGNSVDKKALANHSAIKDELKKTEKKRRMSRMADAKVDDIMIAHK